MLRKRRCLVLREKDFFSTKSTAIAVKEKRVSLSLKIEIMNDKVLVLLIVNKFGFSW